MTENNLIASETAVNEAELANNAEQIAQNRELCDYQSARDMCGWLEHDAWGGRGK